MCDCIAFKISSHSIHMEKTPNRASYSWDQFLIGCQYVSEGNSTLLSFKTCIPWKVTSICILTPWVFRYLGCDWQTHHGNNPLLGLKRTDWSDLSRHILIQLRKACRLSPNTILHMKEQCLNGNIFELFIISEHSLMKNTFYYVLLPETGSFQCILLPSTINSLCLPCQIMLFLCLVMNNVCFSILPRSNKTISVILDNWL